MQRIHSAFSDARVVELVHEYLSTWTQEEIAALPGQAWPPEMPGREEICDYAFHLRVAELGFSGPEEAGQNLQVLVGVFTAAASRIGQLDSHLSLGPRPTGSSQ